jgi:predicted membrane chloride channel (bestrophin family)
MFIILHLCINYAHHTGRIPGADKPSSLWSVDWRKINIIAAITTFFLVFYTNETFNRYTLLYEKTRALMLEITEFSFDCSLNIPGKAGKPYVRLASRYFLCSLVVFMYEVSHQRYLKDSDHFRMLIAAKLLTLEEKSRLDEVEHHHRPMMLLHWAGKVVRHAHEEVLQGKDWKPMAPMIDHIVVARDLQQEVGDICQMPVPWQYYHLLSLMVFVNLVLWAYAMGVCNSAFAPMCYFFSTLIFTGMMELASELSDPFGDDLTDFPIGDWVEEMIGHVAVVLEHECPFEDSNWKDVLAVELNMSINPSDLRVLASNVEHLHIRDM